MNPTFSRLILVFLLLALTMPLAAAQELPEFLQGDVFIDCVPAPVGTMVQAYIDGIEVGETTITTLGTYDLMVQLPDGYYAGAVFELVIDGVSPAIPVTYEPGLTKTMTLLFGDSTNPLLNIIPLKGNIFLGEEKLDLSACLLGATKIAWFKEDADPTTDQPNTIYTVDDPLAFFVDPAKFKDKLGQWYAWDTGTPITVGNYAFYVNDPQIELQIFDQTHGTIVNSGSTIPVGDLLNFKIKTANNLDAVLAERGVFSLCPVTGFINVVVKANETETQYQTLRGPYHDVADTDISLQNLEVTTNPWFWPDNDQVTSAWNTAARDNAGSRLYANGPYAIRAEINLNNMMKNYPDVGKSVSVDQSMTLTDDAVGVSVTPSLVTRMNSFFVTIDGRPDTEYIITLMECQPGDTNLGDCGTLTLDGGDCERPPIIRADQDGVKNGDITFDNPVNTTFPIGDTEYQPNKNLSPECCEGYTDIRDLVPTDDKPVAKCVIENGVRYYAKIKTDAQTDPNPGKRTIEFQTDTTDAPDLTWRIHVQSVASFGGEYTVGDSSITVNKGLLTIQAAEASPFYLGNDITITGTSTEVPLNTDDGIVYLFMTGPCQNKCGNDLLSLKHADPSKDVIAGTPPDCISGCETCWEGEEEMTMNVVKVQSDGTWKFVWKTEHVPIVPGTYTIYASSKQTSACCLDCDCAAYTSMEVTFLEPGIEAEIDPSIIERPFNCCPDGCCQDCAVTLKGIASGFPYVHDNLNGGIIRELNLWIFGQDKVGNDKYINSKVPLFKDGSFDKVCLPVDICTLEPGTYDIILQHPMYNHQFDIVSEDDLTWMDPTYPLPIDENRKWMVSSYPTEWSKVFPLMGPGYFQGEKARDALLDFLNSGYIDDKYIHLTLSIVDKGQPVAEFIGSPREGVRPLTVQFTDKSSGDLLNSWSWTFGDGGTSYDQNPVHTYQTDGVYTVQLKVKNTAGLSDEITKHGYISVGAPLINVDFAGYPTTGEAPLAVEFTDLSTGNPNMWIWDFGDGDTAAGIKNPIHIYEYAGTYTVTLTAMRGSEVGVAQKEGYITITGIGPTPTITPGPIYDKISLYPGWNMISTPKTLAEGYDTAATVFGNVPTGDHAIWEYDSFTNKWVQMEENSVVKPLFGIWIYSTKDYIVPLYFKTETISVPPERNLPAGWSCIGFTGFIPASARDTLLSVYEQWSQTIGWDADYQVYETPMINGGQPPFEDSRYMFPTKGYWLYMSDPGILSALGV